MWRWGSVPPLGHFTPWNRPGTYGTGSWMGPGLVWTGFKYPASSGIWFLDSTAYRESLYHCTIHFFSHCHPAVSFAQLEYRCGEWRWAVNCTHYPLYSLLKLPQWKSDSTRNRPEEQPTHWREEKNLRPCQQSNADLYYSSRHYQNVAQIWKFTVELCTLLC